MECYEQNEIRGYYLPYSLYLAGGTMEDTYAWLQEEYGDMVITPLALAGQ